VASPPFLGTSDINDLNAIASALLERLRIDLRKRLEFSATRFPISQDIRAENAGDTRQPDFRQIVDDLLHRIIAVCLGN
jgi:hypothetical protein